MQHHERHPADALASTDPHAEPADRMSRPDYLAAVARGEPRRNLDATIAEVNAEHRAPARKRLPASGAIMRAPRRPREAELQCGAAAGLGGQPPPRRMQLRSWKRIEKPGSALLGLAGIALPVGGSWLEIDDLPVLTTNGKIWAAWPGKPVLTREGTVAKFPGTSKIHYVNVLRWRDRDTSTRFSQAVVDLVRAADPSAFERQR